MGEPTHLRPGASADLAKAKQAQQDTVQPQDTRPVFPVLTPKARCLTQFVIMNDPSSIVLARDLATSREFRVSLPNLLSPRLAPWSVLLSHGWDNACALAHQR
ncbi:hypothetical protein FRC12_020146 [Ceratobasidium sp. 428]|nr:hypothetical protein FRC12_020146 [Ceratobasidium sp. 428]